MRYANSIGCVAALVGLLSTSVTLGAALPTCTIAMDLACPNAAPICGASFSGGGTCEIIGVPSCYSTGMFSYRVTSASPITITLSDDLFSLSVFFGHIGAATGTMVFRDAMGVLVDGTLGSSTCGVGATSFINFSRAVRTIDVTALNTSGNLDSVWIDTFSINPVGCGNGIVEGLEECDDGNVDPGDGCDAGCVAEATIVPAVSEWGVVVMVVLMLIAGTATFRSYCSRQPAAWHGAFSALWKSQ